MKGKQTKGKQKIELKKIEDQNDCFVCFSKRKSGIHKKANEIATLCGAKIGIMVESPTGKTFSFARPSMDSITNCLIEQDPLEIDSNDPLMEVLNQAKIDELNMMHNELFVQLGVEKDGNKELEFFCEGKNHDRGWWETPMENLGYEEAKSMEASLIGLHKSICGHLKEKTIRSHHTTEAYSNQFDAKGSGATPPTFPTMGGNEEDPGNI